MRRALEPVPAIKTIPPASAAVAKVPTVSLHTWGLTLLIIWCGFLILPHLVMVGKTRVAFDDAWDQSGVCLLSLTATQTETQTYQGWNGMLICFETPLYAIVYKEWHFSQFIRRLFTFRSQLRESWHIYDALKKETSWIAVIGVEKMWKLRVHVWRQNPVIGSNNMWPWQWKTSLHLTTYTLSVTAVVIPGQYTLPRIYTFKHQPLSSPSWRSERKAWRH